MFREIFLALTDTPSDEPALRAAVAFAKAYESRLRVAFALHLPSLVDAYGLTPVEVDEGFVELRKAARERVERLKAQLAGEEIASDVRFAESRLYSSKQVLALQARYADLVFVAAPGPFHSESAVLHGMFATLAKSSGRPVIAVPRDAYVHFPPRTVVVGWSPTPEAARAVHDALPILRSAERVDVVLVEPESGELGHGEEPGADIAAHLAHHGVKVDADVSRRTRGTVGVHLLRSAIEQKADLIVAGAYGHSRAREWAFGGATRELLDQGQVPVLFAH